MITTTTTTTTTRRSQTMTAVGEALTGLGKPKNHEEAMETVEGVTAVLVAIAAGANSVSWDKNAIVNSCVAISHLLEEMFDGKS